MSGNYYKLVITWTFKITYFSLHLSGVNGKVDTEKNEYMLILF